jgi:hypothetical protein
MGAGPTLAEWRERVALALDTATLLTDQLAASLRRSHESRARIREAMRDLDRATDRVEKLVALSVGVVGGKGAAVPE